MWSRASVPHLGAIREFTPRRREDGRRVSRFRVTLVAPPEALREGAGPSNRCATPLGRAGTGAPFPRKKYRFLVKGAEIPVGQCTSHPSVRIVYPTVKVRSLPVPHCESTGNVAVSEEPSRDGIPCVQDSRPLHGREARGHRAREAGAAWGVTMGSSPACGPTGTWICSCRSPGNATAAVLVVRRCGSRCSAVTGRRNSPRKMSLCDWVYIRTVFDVISRHGCRISVRRVGDETGSGGLATAASRCGSGGRCVTHGRRCPSGLRPARCRTATSPPLPRWIRPCPP